MYLLKLFANAIVYYAYNSRENMIFGTTDTKYIVKYSYYDNIIS